MKELPRLVVGDKIRFSVELIRDIDSMPDHSSCILVIRDIRDDTDGTKLVTMSGNPLKDSGEKTNGDS